MTEPLLDPLALPPFPIITAEAIAPALDRAIERHEAAVAAVTDARPTSFADVWLPLERAEAEIDALWSAVSHLHGVADTPELRAAHAAGQERLVENAMKVGQNRDLYDVLVALSATPDFAALPTADRVAVEHAIRDFTLAGVALDDEARARFAAVSVELSTLASEFGSAVLDATEAWSEQVTEEALLAGVSGADKEMFAAAAAAKGLDGWLVTLQQPSVAAILTFADDRDLRFRVYEASATRASDRGPHAGRFDNSARIARILALRREAAGLLGFADPVAWSLATKMAPNAGEVLSFLRDLGARAKPAATRDLAELKVFAADELGITDFQPWDAGYVSNRLRQARYAVEEQEVRAYFPVQRVLADGRRYSAGCSGSGWSRATTWRCGTRMRPITT